MSMLLPELPIDAGHGPVVVSIESARPVAADLVCRFDSSGGPVPADSGDRVSRLLPEARGPAGEDAGVSLLAAWLPDVRDANSR